MTNKIAQLTEMLKNQKYIFIENLENEILFSYSIYIGIFHKQARRLQMLKDYRRILLEFNDEETEMLFKQFKIDEIDDKNILTVVDLILEENHDELEEYIIDKNQYEVPVVQDELIEFINHCNKELDDL